MKIKQLQHYMQTKDIDLTIFFTNETKKDFNVNYFGQAVCEIAYLVIPKKGETILFLSQLEYGSIKADVRIEPLDQKLSKKLESGFRKIRKIGINYDVTSINELKNFRKSFPKSKFTDISKICKQLRETKTEEEIKIIKKACSITDRIMKNCISNFNTFSSEQDVIAFLENNFKKEGCTPSFSPIVASGANAAIPHYKPEGKLKKGFCIIDMGIIYKGYCSDMTRTIYIGKPSEREIDIYKTVLDAQENAISNLKQGKPIKDIDKEMREIMGSYSKYFFHNPGHGLGVEVHEMPALTKYSKIKLKENNIITIEPGIYIPGKLGIRIEDDIVITKKGAVCLTKSPKDLICITSGK
ncbi:MAG: Xaa-Pro peptidase family protein [Nanoarchaeota archaeon]|nr:Xaa-Pro peptidase family protein [Nanoarchaeota archaeon]